MRILESFLIYFPVFKNFWFFFMKCKMEFKFLIFFQVVASEPVNFAQKLMVWIEKKWNPCDLAVIIFFFVGLSLRLNPATRDYGRVIYCLDIMYWYIRSLDFLSVNKYLGPYVTMIGKMVRLFTFCYFYILKVKVFKVHP